MNKEPNWQELPKQFCDRTSIVHGDEVVLIAMSSGTSETAYALPPKHAKAFLQSLQHKISEYEKQYGEIDSNWEPGIKSPIQPDRKK